MQKNTISKTPDNPVAIQKVELLQRRWLSKYVFEIELTRPPDWDFKQIAARNPFFNQVVEPFAELLPDAPVTMEDLDDIREADKDDRR